KAVAVVYIGRPFNSRRPLGARRREAAANEVKPRAPAHRTRNPAGRLSRTCPPPHRHSRLIVKTLLVAFVADATLVARPALAQPPDTLSRIKAAKQINVAYSRDSLPFSFDGPNGAPVGYTIDLCKRIITQIGRTVGVPDLKINWVPGTVAERLQMVASGRA